MRKKVRDLSRTVRFLVGFCLFLLGVSGFLPSALAQTSAITSVSPASGVIGTPVAITGSGFGAFVSATNNKVTFNGVPALIGSWSDTQIVVSVPFSGTTGPLTVINGAVTVTGPVFTVTSGTVTALGPSTGVVGTPVQLSWTGGLERLADNNLPRLNGLGAQGQYTVLFGGVPSPNVANKSATGVTWAVPFSAVTGPVVVRIAAADVLPDGTVVQRTLDVTGPVFTVTQPSITGISPTAGPVGTAVRLSWIGGLERLATNILSRLSGFGAQGQYTVLFGGVPSEVATNQSADGVTWQVPFSAVTGPVVVRIAAADVLPDGTVVQRTLDVTGPVFTVTNTQPVANAGVDQSVRVGDLVTLDGSGSIDADGDPLTFSWAFVSKPTDSLTTLSNPNIVNPQFVVDKAGSYVVQLIVNDGIADSQPDTVTISTVNSPPIANAGPDQGVTVGQTVQLDGSGSFDPDGDPLTFSWSLTFVPSGSTATLSNPTAVNPTFVADVFGTYVVRLVVHDGLVASKADEVTISTINVAPIANAGPDQAVEMGDTVLLDGRASTDPDGQPLTFKWSFVSRPAQSFAALSDPTSPTPTFVPDVAGSYPLQLIVNDGIADSQPDTVSITAVSAGTVLALLKDAINLISSAPSTAFVNPNSPRALINKLEAVIRQVEAGSLTSARDQLNGDLLPKTDGCALRGSPDGPTSGHVRDWIVSCEVQGQVYPLIQQAIDTLNILIGP